MDSALIIRKSRQSGVNLQKILDSIKDPPLRFSILAHAAGDGDLFAIRAIEKYLNKSPVKAIHTLLFKCFKTSGKIDV